MTMRSGGKPLGPFLSAWIDSGPTASEAPDHAAASPVVHHDGLRGREFVQRLEALLAAVAGALDAAEGQLDAAAGAEAVDEDLAAAHGAGDPHRAPGVAGPDAGDEAVGRAVGEPDR